MKRICRNLQGTKDNGIVFIPSKKLVLVCSADAYFSGLWVHEDPQYPICARSRTGFVVTFFQLSSIFKGSNSLAELDNATYSEYRVERAISVYSFDTHNRGKLEKVTTNPVLLLS